MKITENFVGVVEKLKYASFKNENKFKKEEDCDETYVCNVTIAEVGRGLARYKQYHSIVIYLTEEQFKEKIIEKGDRINILTGAKWQSTPLTYKSYSPEAIEKADKSQLKMDENGKTYWQTYVYSYKIVCKPDTWSMNCKYYDQNYCTVFESGVKLPLEDKKAFDIESFDYFLDKDEFEKLKNFNEKECRVILYNNKNKVKEKIMLVHLEENIEEKTYYLLLSTVGE